MISLSHKNLWVALAIIIAPSFALAQGKGRKDQPIAVSAETRAQIVRRAFQTETQLTLDKYLKPHQYNVQVKFDLAANAEGSDDVPYAPDSIIPDAFQGLPSGKQLDALQNLSVVIQVPKWVDAETKKTLQAMTERNLSQKTGKPISVGIESVALDVEEPTKNPPPNQQPMPAQAIGGGGGGGAQAAELARAMDEIKDLKKKVEETAAAQANAAAGAGGGGAAGGGAGGGAGAGGASGEGALSKGTGGIGAGGGGSWLADLVLIARESPLATIISLVLLYLGILILVFVPSRSIVSGFKQFQSAFDSLGKALKSMGESMGRAAPAEGSGGGEGEDDDSSESAAPAMLAPPLAPGAPTRELNAKELMEKVETIRKNHTADYDRIVVDLVVSYLHDENKSYWAVFLLDMLGRENARRVFESLDPGDQEELMRLVKHEIPEDKLQASAELIDAYQMRLLTFGWKGGGKSRSLDPDLQRVVGQLAFEDIPPILNRLGEAGIRRFLLYLDSKNVSQLIRSVRRNPQSQKLLVNLLARMPESINEQNVDADIRLQIKAFFQKKQDDLYLPYLTQYEEIVAQVGDELEDDLIEQLGEANQEIGHYLRRKLVTVGSFFNMPGAEQKDLLANFTNNDFALFLSSLTDESQKQQVFGLLDTSRRELVTEQLSVLAEESKLVLVERHKDVRRRLRQMIKQNRASGSEFSEAEDTSISPLGKGVA